MASQLISSMICMNYYNNKMFGLLQFHSGYGQFYLNSPKGYSQKIINAQTDLNYSAHTVILQVAWPGRLGCHSTARSRRSPAPPATDLAPSPVSQIDVSLIMFISHVCNFVNNIIYANMLICLTSMINVRCILLRTARKKKKKRNHYE